MKFLGVASWRGWSLAYSDGMCTDCSARARSEWSLPSAAPRPALVPRARSLSPDFAVATGILLITVGVAFGMLIGPPPRTASLPADPATSVATGDERELAVGRGGAGVTTHRPAGTTPRTAGDALAGLDHGPLRITRAVARRPARAAYQPVIVRSIERMGPMPRGRNTRARSSDEISPLDLVPVQAP